MTDQWADARRGDLVEGGLAPDSSYVLQSQSLRLFVRLIAVHQPRKPPQKCRQHQQAPRKLQNARPP